MQTLREGRLHVHIGRKFRPAGSVEACLIKRLLSDCQARARWTSVCWKMSFAATEQKRPILCNRVPQSDAKPQERKEGPAHMSCIPWLQCVSCGCICMQISTWFHEVCRTYFVFRAQQCAALPMYPCAHRHACEIIPTQTCVFEHPLFVCAHSDMQSPSQFQEMLAA
jgi:hypothetical protein